MPPPTPNSEEPHHPSTPQKRRIQAPTTPQIMKSQWSMIPDIPLLQHGVALARTSAREQHHDRRWG